MILNKLDKLEDFKILRDLLGILRIVLSMHLEKRLVLCQIKHQLQDQQLVMHSIFMIWIMTVLLIINLIVRKYQFKYSGIRNNQDILEFKLK